MCQIRGCGAVLTTVMGLVGATLFEECKEALAPPAMTRWQSHVVTVMASVTVACAVCALVVRFLAMNGSAARRAEQHRERVLRALEEAREAQITLRRYLGTTDPLSSGGLE